MNDSITPGASPVLKVRKHNREPHAVNSFMIANSFGEIVGGNLQAFKFDYELSRYDYPTRFKSRAEGNRWLKANADYVAVVEATCEIGA